MHNIIALHGFLGEPTAWNELANSFNLTKIDLYEESSRPISSLVRKVSDKIKEKRSEKMTLIGYSLGGRVALEIALNSIEHIDQIILLGAHPGLNDESEKSARKEWLKTWQHTIETTDQKEFLTRWNKQEIFKYDSPIESIERSKDEIISLLKFFPLGEQRDFRDFIAKHSNKIHFGVGEHDQKYQEIYREIGAPNLMTFKGCGHRLVNENVLKEISLRFK